MFFPQKKWFTSIEEAECEPLAVRQLRLWNQDLLPDGRLCRFVNLHSLDIRWCNIAQLPEDIARLDKLRSLHILNLPLDTWPHWLCSMTGLRDLAIRGTDIVDIPQEIGHLVNLRKLDLSNGYFQEIPPELARLKKLKQFSASDNFLASIPDELDQLPGLTSLNFVLNIFAPAERERLKAKYNRTRLLRSRSIHV